jgi:predicted molibdopterin-dependent oxidoreductase YjgC
VTTTSRIAAEEAPVTIIADGRTLRVAAGTSVAAALLAAGVEGFRRSVLGEPRGPLCGMGVCYECRVAIDDVPLRRACLLPVAEGMRVSTREAS